MKRRRPQKKSSAWQSSAQWKSIGSAAIKRWNATRHLKPRCGARRKLDGGPCQHLAMANGRCHRHGGRSPSGAEWHRPVWPDGKAPNAMKKMNRKLATLQKAAAKRQKRIARMTPEELAAYRKWQRTHTPGSAKARQRIREDRKQALAMRAEIIQRDQATALAQAIQNREGVFA